MAEEVKATIEEIRLILKFMSKGYKVPKIIHDVVFEVAKREIEEKDRVVIYKRDPNIGSRRMQGSRVKIIDGSTITINPSAVGGFGADFDGDSICGGVRCVVENENKTEGQTIKYVDCHIGDILSETDAFDFYAETINDGKRISKFKPKSGYTIKILSINIDTGLQEMKTVTEYSIHSPIQMYKIEDPVNRFESFWSSSDHSLIVFDELDQKIKKISPIDLIENPKGKYLIKSKENGYEGANY